LELTNNNGNKVRGFKDLVDLRVEHFKDIYKELGRATIGETVRVISYFPRMTKNEDN